MCFYKLCNKNIYFSNDQRRIIGIINSMIGQNLGKGEIPFGKALSVMASSLALLCQLHGAYLYIDTILYDRICLCHI